MGDLLEKFGLTEFFAFLCPGVVVGTSALLWINPKLSNLLGKELADQQVVVGLLLLVASYTVGMVVSSFGTGGSYLYLRNKRKIDGGVGSNGLWRQMILYLSMIPLVLFWIPDPKLSTRANRSIIEANLRISEDLETFGGLQGQVVARSQWDLLSTYRAVMSGRVGEVGRPIVAELEAMHRRVLFALGVSAALLILAVVAVSKIFLPFALLQFGWSPQPPEIGFPSLLAIAIGATLGCFLLRLVAGHWWLAELFLTRALTVARD